LQKVDLLDSATLRIQGK